MSENRIEVFGKKAGWFGAVALRAALMVGLWLEFHAGAAEPSPLNLKSPNEELALTFSLKEFGGATGCPVYAVTFNGAPVITESRLGLEIKDAPLAGQFVITKKSATSHDSFWQPVYGERSGKVRDLYNQLVVDLKETAPPHRVLQLTFRAYDAGVAFHYALPKQAGLDSATIVRENSEFRFPADAPAWAAYKAQAKYEEVPVSQIKPGCERPLIVQANTNRYVALAEARMVEYSRMKFAPLTNAVHSLVSDLDSPVTSALPMRSPWRVVMVAPSPGRLLENNDLILNLNDPCALADTSWIKPGKVIRAQLSTESGKACVDFAAAHKFQYVLFDAGWYGPEGSSKSDARAVNLDPARLHNGPLDLAEVIRYGKERGIGVILYVNHIAAEKQLDEILPLYRSWGVKGVKYGFVNVGPQKWTSWLHMAVRKAAENQLMVDVHDEYRPTGYQRTYPNWMTAEGIRGDEEKDRSNAQALITQFARFLAGPADNTFCYYNERVARQANHAHQLAKMVCFYSPWQFMFWYDQPGGTGNGRIGNEPELKFIAEIPTVWDDTKVLAGEMGKFSLIARRSGSDWFIGAMNAEAPQDFSVPLTFLAAGKKYTAHIYSHDPAVPTRTKVKIETQPVTRATVLQIPLIVRSGAAIRIVSDNN